MNNLYIKSYTLRKLKFIEVRQISSVQFEAFMRASCPRLSNSYLPTSLIHSLRPPPIRCGPGRKAGAVEQMGWCPQMRLKFPYSCAHWAWMWGLWEKIVNYLSSPPLRIHKSSTRGGGCGTSPVVVVVGSFTPTPQPTGVLSELMMEESQGRAVLPAAPGFSCCPLPHSVGDSLPSSFPLS